MLVLVIATLAHRDVWSRRLMIIIKSRITVFVIAPRMKKYAQSIL